MPITVLLADDQALLRTAFRVMLDASPDLQVVAEAADGQEAVDQAVRLVPDVVLMDVRMPRLDGIQATAKIVAATSSKVLILTTFDLDEYAFAGLRAGASGFLLKDMPAGVLHDALRAVAAGDAVLTPRITRDLVDRYAHAPHPQPAGSTRDPLLSLTSREREVFSQVATGLSNSEIAQQLFLTEATVKSHITRLLAKLHLRDRVQVVIYAYENGLR